VTSASAAEGEPSPSNSSPIAWRAFEQDYVQTSTDPDSDEERAVRYGDLVWDRHGDPVAQVIGEAAGIDDEPAEAIRAILGERNYDMDLAQMGEESPFDEDSYYQRAEIYDDEFQTDWDQFERSLKSEARFFSRSAAATLAGVFDGICEATTRTGGSVIRLIGPEQPLSSLYRARVLQQPDDLEEALKRPDLHVGPPASHVARAGRMNARGVPVFYGATDWEIALAEVRPPVGSNVVIAKFDVSRTLRLLDVKALGDVIVSGSIFDPTLAGRSKRAKFLQRLSARITQPVMPEVEEFEYLVTQAMADYLADRPDLDLDGIDFPSIQRRGKGSNVVLFHKAARLQLLDLPQDTQIQAYLHGGYDEDDDDLEWSVYEETPAPKQNEKPEAGTTVFGGQGLMTERWSELETDVRRISLTLDAESIVVRRIDAIQFRSRPIPVKRTRRVRSDGFDF